MKILSFRLLTACFILVMISCGKTTRDNFEIFDKVDMLFSNLKVDEGYQEYFKLIKSTSQIFIENGRNSKQNDSLILKDNSLSLSEKYQKAGYSNYPLIQENSLRLYKLYNYLIIKYPDYKTLSDSENKKLINLSTKYLNKVKT